MKTEQEDNAVRVDTRYSELVDQHCGQRYTVFNAFLNLYVASGNEFYAQCAKTFAYESRS